MTGKTRSEILADALKLGAALRLSELNHERDILLKVLGKRESRNQAQAILEHVKGRPAKVKKRKYTKRVINPPVPEAPKRSYNGKHWMQRPENREKMMTVLRKMQRGRRAQLRHAS